MSTAYTRAGTTFAGAMSQYFVVMSDDHLRGGGGGCCQLPIAVQSAGVAGLHMVAHAPGEPLVIE